MKRLTTIVGASLLAAVLMAASAAAQEFSLATWNAEQASVEQAARREVTLGKLGATLRTKAGGKLPDVRACRSSCAGA